MRGGIEQYYGKTPVNKPAAPKMAVEIDEFFPLFEDRCIRPDPLDLRHSFPAQAVGAKATVTVVDKISNPDEEEMHVLNELGVDRFEIIIDTESWCRALRFGMNEVGGGFDPRWHTGDWSNELTTQMLINPSESLNLDDHIQKTNEIFLDENAMISSDLFNVTAKISNISLRVPAAIQQNARSCDITLVIDEIMLVVSSALPRTFLTGKLGTAIYGDDPEKQAPIVFPNDPSDVCYHLNKTEDPLIRQKGEMTKRIVSTFRLQLTMRGLSLNLVPVIPYCNAPQPQELLAPMEMTMIACFEGEPPETPESDLIKIVVFFSMQIHQIVVNLDFDIIAGAVCTGMYHAQILEKTVNDLMKLMAVADDESESLVSAVDVKTNASEDETRIASSMTGRRVLVRRQIERSRQTGGLGLEFYAKLGGLHINVWRQNVPLLTRFRSSVLNNAPKRHDNTPMRLIKLTGVSLEGIEFAVEGNGQQENRRLIAKAILSKFGVDVCDFDGECDRERQAAEQKNLAGPTEAREISVDDLDKEDEDAKEPLPDPLMTPLISLEADPAICKGMAIRAEEWKEGGRSFSFAGDADVMGAINLHIHEIEAFFLLFVEGLLIPIDVEIPKGRNAETLFPEGSIGALLSSLVPAEVNDQHAALLEKSMKEAKKEVEAGADVIEVIHGLLLKKLPEDLSRLLLRFALGEITVFVPHQEGIDQTIDTEIPWFGVSLQKLLIRSGYFAKSDLLNDEQIMHVAASCDQVWSGVFSGGEAGFRHLARSFQSLKAVAPDEPQKVTSTLVPSFEVEGDFSRDRINFSMGESTISLQDFENAKHLYASLLCFKDRILLMAERIESVVAAMEASKKLTKQAPPEVINAAALSLSNNNNQKYATAVKDADAALSNGRSLFEKLQFTIEKHDVEMRRALQKRQEAVEQLQIEVFLKEKSRLAALALVSCQAAGWIRVGGMHVFGQRTPSTSTMWKYHAVLRKSLLILYAGPGKPRPLDVVFLQGARLMSLAGGRRKRDIKFGFALCEYSGTVRFFIVPNGPEYETWIRELQRSIDKYTPRDFPRVASTLGLGGQNEVNNIDEGHEDALRLRTLSSDLDDNESLAGSDGGAKRGQQFKNRLKDMAANTRSKVGTAVQAAREKRDRRTVESGDLSDSQHGATVEAESVTSAQPTEATASTSNTSVPNSFEEQSSTRSAAETESLASAAPVVAPAPVAAPVDSISVEPETENQGAFGNRFKSMRSIRSNAKNRFGNAVQVAREKAQAIAEEQRRKTESAPGGSLRNRLGAVAANARQGQLLNTSQHPTTPLASNASAAFTETPRKRTTSSDSVEDRLGVAENNTEGGEREAEVDDETSQSGRGQQLKDRFSSFGASLRQTPGTKSTSTDEDVSKSMFNFRRTFGGQESTAEVSDFIKLKSIITENGHPAAGNEKYALPNGDDPPTERLRGNWTTNVQSMSSSRTEQPSKGITGEDNPEEKEHGPPSEESERGDVAQFNSGKRIFSIKIFSPDLDAEKKISVQSINKEFSDIVCFYVKIANLVSEVVDLDHWAEKSSESVDNDEDGRVQSSLGVAPLDIVNLTAELLGGLLDTSSRIQAVVPYHEYQCKFLCFYLSTYTP